MNQTNALPRLLLPPLAPGKYASLALTVVVHTILAAFLIYGIRWQTQAPEAVEVELIRDLPTSEVKPQPAPEPPPTPRVAEKPAPPPAPAKPDIAIKTKEKPAKPVKDKAPAKVDPFAEQLRHEQEHLDQRKAVVAASEELAKMKAAQSSAARNKAIAGYVDKIKAKIRGNLVVPPDMRGNPEAVFEVTQLPSGEILSVKLKTSSRSAVLDAAIERAILKSSPLPKPEQGDIFSRSLDLHFKPLED